MKIGFQTLNFLRINRPKTKIGMTPCVNYQTLKQDVFEKRAEPIYFGTIPCSTKSFEIRNIKNLECPICQKIMLNDEQINEFGESVQDKKGEKLIEALDKYGREEYWTGEKTDRTIYSEQKQKVVDIIKDLASKNPELDLSQLVKLRALEYAQDLSKKEIEVLAEIKDFALLNVDSEAEKENLFNIIDESMEFANCIGEDAFKRKKFLYAIKKSVSNKSVQDEINKIAQKLPTSNDDIDAFFVKYSKEQRKNAEIATSLARGNTPTADHLIPQSEKGKDFIENFLCDCMECNSNRMSTPFGQWVQDIPEIEDNLQKHLDKVQEQINEGKLSSNYDFYPQGVSKTIFSLTQGQINLRTLDKKDSQFEKILSRRMIAETEMQKRMAYLKEQIDSQRQEVDVLKEVQKRFKMDGKNEQFKEITKQIKAKYQEINALENEMQTNKKDLKLIHYHTKKYSNYENA